MMRFLADLPIIRINVQAETAEEYIGAASRRFGAEFFVPTNEELGDRVRIEAPFLGGSVGVRGEAIATPAIIDGRKGYYLRMIDLDRDSVMIMIPGPPDDAPAPAPPPPPRPRIPTSRDTPPLPLPVVKPAAPAKPADSEELTAEQKKAITTTQPFRIAEKLPGVVGAPPPGGAPLTPKTDGDAPVGAVPAATVPLAPIDEAAKADAAAKFEAAKAIMAAKAEAAKAAPKADGPERAKSATGSPERAKSTTGAGAKPDAAKAERAKSDTSSGAPKADAVRSDGTYGAAWAASKSGGVRTGADATSSASDATKADAATSDAKADAPTAEAKTDAAKPDAANAGAATTSAAAADAKTDAKDAAAASADATKARPGSPTNTEPTAPAMEPAAAAVAAARPVDSRRRVMVVLAASIAMVLLTIFLVTRRSTKPAATKVATVEQDASLATIPPDSGPGSSNDTGSSTEPTGEIPIVRPPNVDEPKTTRTGRGSDSTNRTGSGGRTGTNTNNTSTGNTRDAGSGNSTDSGNSNSNSNSNSIGSGSNTGSGTGSGATVKRTAAPQSLSPRDTARITCKFGTEIELVWREVLGATSYTVEVARDASFSSVAATLDATNTVAIFRPMAPGVFFWRVSAKAAAGRSDPSGVRQFTCTAD